ncbi:FtsH protease activity modulator HflK [Exilibacterium tricleocarpae]|uniref:Protein HflK n=1 Tax=Exilibacterium tricleocarpae TaxID=2591008 RepID=A0A545T5Y8_9GAMM|nr:FtsH protease activity modulator HflK [Exilibacterium tricleocarpae]TQV72633.1 FtsH protease activity modulator HflK [Exilibacterium tricleocarpae]
MAWNEPGGNNQDPWGGKRNNEGPPDLDEALKKFQDKLNGLFGGGKSKGPAGSGRGMSSTAVVVALVILALVYGFAGINIVNEQERAVVLRLGVYHTTFEPGLNWAPPLIDQVFPVNVTKVRLLSKTGQMLTEDLNIVEVNVSVQYSIADARDFVLQVRDPEGSLAQATESALRHVAGSSEMHEVLTEGRERIAVDIMGRLQNYIDTYDTGILVEKVNVEETNPPRDVQEAFDDVNRAREDEERKKNEAEAYAMDILPRARGMAQRVLEEAAAYKAQVVARAEGEAQRFEKLLAEYSRAPEVTRERLYLDAVQEVMANSSKVMIDVEGGNNMLYIPLDKIVQQSSAAVGQGAPMTARELDSKISEIVRREINSGRSRREGR